MDAYLNDVDPPLRWADEISVAKSERRLVVTGLRFDGSQTDLMKEYERAEFSPHLEFANCLDENTRIGFVMKFGPVNVERGSETSLRPMDGPIRSKHSEPYERRRAIQLLDELRDDQEILRAALQLLRLIEWGQGESVSPLRSPRTTAPEARSGDSGQNGSLAFSELKEQTEIIRRLTKTWPDQHDRTRKMIARLYKPDVEWRWTRSDSDKINSFADKLADSVENELDPEGDIFRINPFAYAKYILLVLVNAFPTPSTWYGRFMQERPPDDLLFGIRPVLFAMLHRDAQQNRPIRMCDRLGCGNLYIAKRSDKLCCSLPCSIKHNARRYHLDVRKPQREKAANRPPPTPKKTKPRKG